MPRAPAAPEMIAVLLVNSIFPPKPLFLVGAEYGLDCAAQKDMEFAPIVESCSPMPWRRYPPCPPGFRGGRTHRIIPRGRRRTRVDAERCQPRDPGFRR